MALIMTSRGKGVFVRSKYPSYARITYQKKIRFVLLPLLTSNTYLFIL
jgi:hypothetical protein